MLTFSKSDATTFPGVVSGTGQLRQFGIGLVRLTGDNTYTGGTTVTGTGGLQIGNGGVTGSVVGNITNDTALTFNRSDASTYAGVISGAGTVTKLAAGALTLTGANTYTGMTTVSTGTFSIGNGGTTGSLVGNVTNNAAMQFNRTDVSTYSGVISGTGTVTKTGSGTLTLPAPIRTRAGRRSAPGRWR